LVSGDSTTVPDTSPAATKITLLGAGSVGTGAVRAKLQINLTPSEITFAGKHGTFAWWVGVENQEARIPKPYEHASDSGAAWSAQSKSHSVVDTKPFRLEKLQNDAAPAAKAISLHQTDLIADNSALPASSEVSHDLSTSSVGMHKGRLCGEDAFRRLCAGLDTTQVETWFAPTEQMIHHAIPPNAVADWDSTVIQRYGKQEDAVIGYNPQKPGRPSHHPLACVIAGTRRCLHMEWRKGNTVSSSSWVEAMEKVWRSSRVFLACLQSFLTGLRPACPSNRGELQLACQRSPWRQHLLMAPLSTV